MSRPATSRLKVNPPLGSLPVLQYCAPDQLRIDAAYQRSLETGPSQTLIRKIAMFWNWDLCQPLVVARRSDGGLYVVDGQHRLAGAKLRRDIAQLPCVVSTYATASDEAASFVALNQMRRPLSAVDIFKAALVAEDEEAVTILRALTDAGLRLAEHSNHTAWKPGMIANIGGIQRVYRRSGHNVVRVALSALAKAWPGLVLQYAGTVFPGFAAVALDEHRLRSDPATTIEDLAALAGRLSQMEWRLVASRAAAEAGGSTREGAEVAFRAAWRARHSPPVAKVATVPAPSFAVALAPAEMAWCQQCDQRVSGARAARCADRFCKMRQAVAA
jgi:hypothetical protein